MNKFDMLKNLFLRILTMGGKFVLIIFAVKFLSPDDVSEYGALISFISLAIYFFGFDLYISTARLYGNECDFKHSIAVQYSCYIILFFILVGVTLFFFESVFAKISLYLLFFLIVIEFLAQEIVRFLLSIGLYIKSSMVFFIKSGSWCYIAAILIYFEIIKDLDGVIIVWIFSCILSILLGSYFVKNYSNYLICKPYFELKELYCRFKSQSIIFISSLSFLLVTNMDKIVINTFQDKEKSAAYVLFSSITGAIITLIYAGLINPFFKGFSSSDLSVKRKVELLKSFAFKSLILFLFIVSFVIVLSEHLLFYLKKESYLDFFYILYFLCIFSFLHTLSLIPHFFLYIHKRDNEIAISSALSLMATSVLMYKSFYEKSHLMVIMSLIVGVIFMLFSKVFFSFRLRNDEKTAR